MSSLPERFDDFVREVAAPRSCSHDGCGAPGEFVLRIKLWAKGYPKASTPPLESTFTLRVCAEHRYDVAASGFWTDEGRARIEAALAAAGRAAPDFETAEFFWVRAATALGGDLSMN